MITVLTIPKEGLEQYGQRFLDSFASKGGQTYKNVMLRRTMCAQPNLIAPTNFDYRSTRSKTY